MHIYTWINIYMHIFLCILGYILTCNAVLSIINLAVYFLTRQIGLRGTVYKHIYIYIYIYIYALAPWEHECPPIICVSNAQRVTAPWVKMKLWTNLFSIQLPISSFTHTLTLNCLVWPNRYNWLKFNFKIRRDHEKNHMSAASMSR